MRNGKRLWLEGRLILYGTLVITVTVAIFSFIQYRRAKSLTEDLIVKQMKASASSLAYIISNPGNKEELQDVIENFVKNMRREGYDELQLHVVDSRGSIIASGRREEVGRNIKDVLGDEEAIWARAFSGEIIVAKVASTRGIMTMDVSIPIPKWAGGYQSVDYVIHYMIPYPQYRASLGRILLLEVTSALTLALALLVPLAIFMRRNVLNPIRKIHLADQAAMADDQEAMYVPLKGIPNGELGDIIRVRNNLLQSLTERERETKRLYEEISQSEEKYRSLFEKANDSILLVNEDGKIAEANLKAFETFGYSRDELIGADTSILLPEAEGEAPSGKTLPTCPLGCKEETVISTELVRKDGKALQVTLSCKVMEHLGQRLSLLIVRDMTHERELQEQASRAEKLASLGRLSAGIIHEIKNPLTTISMTAQLLGLRKKDSPATLDRLDMIERQVARINHLLEGIRRFSRKSEPKMVPCDLNRIIKETVPLVEIAIRRKDGEMKLELDPSLSLVMADPDQMTQVLINLISNAADALSNGGNITVRTAPEKEKWAMIKVKDTGCGIPEENINTIFEPFFTTKPREEGTGLGLAIVHGIINDHGGEISVESRRGEGTTFTIHLPNCKSYAEKTV